VEELRQRIDAIDAQIVELLNERAQCAVEIGNLKRSVASVMYVPEREKMILDALRSRNHGPLPDAAIKAIYREIISATRALEKPTTVGFLGPRDTFSHMALPCAYSAARANTTPWPPSKTFSQRSSASAWITASCLRKHQPEAA